MKNAKTQRTTRYEIVYVLYDGREGYPEKNCSMNPYMKKDTSEGPLNRTVKLGSAFRSGRVDIYLAIGKHEKGAFSSKKS